MYELIKCAAKLNGCPHAKHPRIVNTGRWNGMTKNKETGDAHAVKSQGLRVAVFL